MLCNILVQTSTLPSCQCDSVAACRSWMSCRTRYLWKSTEMFLWSGSMKTILACRMEDSKLCEKLRTYPMDLLGQRSPLQESVARSTTVKKHCEQFQQFCLKGFLYWARPEHSLILYYLVRRFCMRNRKLFGWLVVSSVLHKPGA